MQITVFSKKRTTREGKKFDTFFATLAKKTGEEVTVSVKFREECGQPKAEECPMNIVFQKEDGNLSSRKYTKLDEKTGEMVEGTSQTLWLSGWKLGEPYVDHSLDEFF